MNADKALYDWLLENHFHVLEAARKVMAERPDYDLQDATDSVASDVFNYWCEYEAR